MKELRQPMFGSAIGPWHRTFAWLPVRTWDHRLVWLRSVERRRIQLHDHLFNPHGNDQWWQYRPAGERLVGDRD